MADTSYAPGVIVNSPWLRDVNTHVYQGDTDPRQEPFNAILDGVTDNSAAVQAALNSGARTVRLSRGNWRLRDITIPSGKTLDCSGAQISIIAGATFGFRLIGFNPKLLNCFIVNSLASSEAILVSDSLGAIVSNTTILNSGLAIRVNGTGVSPAPGLPPNCEGASLSNLIIYSFALGAISVQNSTSGLNISDVYINAQRTPSSFSYGIRFDGVFNARSNVSNTTIINTVYGCTFGTSDNITLTNITISSIAGIGFWASSASSINISNSSVNFGAKAVLSSINSSQIHVRGLSVFNIGVIPPGQPPTYYTSNGFAPPYRDLDVTDVSRLTITASDYASSGPVRYTSASGVTWKGATTIPFSTGVTVNAGSSLAVSPAGTFSIPDPSVNIRADEAIVLHRAVFSTPFGPGASQIYNYSIRVDGTTTPLATLSDTATSVIHEAGLNPIIIPAGSNYCFLISTSGGSAVQKHFISYTYSQAAA